MSEVPLQPLWACTNGGRDGTNDGLSILPRKVDIRLSGKGN